jgi:hypothetical protein
LENCEVHLKVTKKGITELKNPDYSQSPMTETLRAGQKNSATRITNEEETKRNCDKIERKSGMIPTQIS